MNSGDQHTLLINSETNNAHVFPQVNQINCLGQHTVLINSATNAHVLPTDHPNELLRSAYSGDQQWTLMHTCPTHRSTEWTAEVSVQWWSTMNSNAYASYPQVTQMNCGGQHTVDINAYMSYPQVTKVLQHVWISSDTESHNRSLFPSAILQNDLP